jgi:hemerythrin-like metal-binding protein
MITWNREFETGIKEIDVSNRVMLFEINEFYESVLKGNTSEKTLLNFERIVTLTEIKFKNEILIYQEYGFDEHKIIEHAKIHNSFLYILEKAGFDSRKGNLSNMIPFAGYLKLWIMEHIMTDDKEIGKSEKENHSVGLTAFS